MKLFLNYLRFQLGLDTTLTGGQTLVGLTASDCGCLRKTSLDLYVEKLASFLESHSEVGRIIDELSAERRATEADLARFTKTDDNGFVDAANLLTERHDKLIASKVLAERLRKIAADTQNPEDAIELLAIAGDIASNGFGLGGITCESMLCNLQTQWVWSMVKEILSV